ncbi:hypothetical protein GJ496_004844 [Pomphorhynchus laevis]|nr:hypothetical protein GJ496_004844 [Pomphorhynchus laevis]
MVAYAVVPYTLSPWWPTPRRNTYTPVYAGIDRIQNHEQAIAQKLYAEDANIVGSAEKCHSVLYFALTEGPKYGFNCSQSKCRLLVHPNNFSHAERIFTDSYISVLCEGIEILVSHIVPKPFIDGWFENKVNGCTTLVDRLAEVSNTDPQNAYACLAHAVQHKLCYAQIYYHEFVVLTISTQVLGSRSAYQSHGSIGDSDPTTKLDLELHWSSSVCQAIDIEAHNEDALQSALTTIRSGNRFPNNNTCNCLSSRERLFFIAKFQAISQRGISHLGS